MHNAVKVLLFVLASFVLVFHFCMLSLYSFSSSTNKSTWQYRADHYSYPFFQQGWRLFAPAPSVSYKLFVDFEQEGRQQLELIGDCHGKHQNNLLAGREAPLLALSNSAHFFEKSTNLTKSLNGPVLNDISFNILEQQALRAVNQNRQNKVQSLKLILHVNDFTQQKSYVYFNSSYVTLKK